MNWVPIPRRMTRRAVRPGHPSRGTGVALFSDISTIVTATGISFSLAPVTAAGIAPEAVKPNSVDGG